MEVCCGEKGPFGVRLWVRSMRVWWVDGVLRGHGASRLSLWTNIRRGWNAFSSFTVVEAGDCSHTRFLHYIWCGHFLLKESFPRLFCLARNMDAIVANFRIVSNDIVHWDINLIRLMHDWEVDFISSFFNVLYSNRVGREGDDRSCWTPSKRRSFEVKSFYKVILSKVDSSFP
jgi:hypothetical protein